MKKYDIPHVKAIDLTPYKELCDDNNFPVISIEHPIEEAKYDLDYYGEEGYDPEGYGW